MICERIWQHICVEREKVARVGHIFKWQRQKIVSLKPEEVECSLCCRLYYRPTTTPCGHTLCEPCLNRCLDHNTICPVCRSPLTIMLGKYQHKPCIALATILKECLPEDYLEREREHRSEQGTLINLTEILSTDGYQDSFELSLFVCCLAFPYVQCNLHIFEPRYRLMIRQAWESESKCFGMCVPLGDTFYQFGTILKINNHQILDDGRVMINTIGVRRFTVLSHYKRDGYIVALVCLISDTDRHIESERVSVEMRNALAYAVSSANVQIAEMLGTIPEHSEGEEGPDGPGWIWYGLGLAHLRGTEISPEVLGDTSAISRYRKLRDLFLRKF
ncbi:LON peptidase N-terminal domain and RING finger protein 3-like [Oopsacas minuta]|uniref:RING finger protein 3-like n=1 Tax=Oopsacas minuta TaxID=111878 RepID=A0AAV7K6I9_9METZ|nr:RING finger protein 3-like [Oopsacas minuta]KAI6656318.1 LON peptidase N-terminal domain and RING finger protein 3-like [Oopsacas minuta]